MILTMTQFKKLEPGDIFTTGTFLDVKDNISVFDSRAILRWVAIKLSMNRWIIKVGYDATQSQGEIKVKGTEIRSLAIMKKLVPEPKFLHKQYVKGVKGG